MKPYGKTKNYRHVKPWLRMINSWHVTEKLDGTNSRLVWTPLTHLEAMGRRTDRCGFEGQEDAILDCTGDRDELESRFAMKFTAPVCVYGECVGPGIQKNPHHLPEKEFRGFAVAVGDQMVGWSYSEEIMDYLGVPTVPYLGLLNSKEVEEAIMHDAFRLSVISPMDDVEGEGIICEPKSPVYTARGERIMFKMKWADIRKGGE